MAKLFDILELDADAQARMIAEERTNPAIRDLALKVKVAVLDGLDTTDKGFVTATTRLLIIQRELAEALEKFDIAQRMQDCKTLGHKNRAEIGYG